MAEKYRKIRDDELIERLEWVMDDIARLQETAKVVHIGVINDANLNSMENHVSRVIEELRSRANEANGG